MHRLGAGEARCLVRRAVPYLGDAEQIEIDLRGPVDHVTDAFAGVETVVHLAGENEVVAAEDPDGAMADTLVASRHVAEAAARAGVARIVYASTVHVYGARLVPGAEIDENVPPAPISPYAVARLASEHLLAATGADGIDVVVLRLTNVVGAPADIGVDRWTLVANDLCREAVTRGTVTLRSSGRQCRDFVAADDVERVFAATLAGRVPAGTYNLGSGHSTTVRALAELVCERVEQATGSRPELVAPVDGTDEEPYRIVVDRLRSLGLEPQGAPADAVDGIVALCLAGEGAPAEPSKNPRPEPTGSHR